MRTRASWPSSIRVSATKIGTLFRATGIGPAPRRAGPRWGQFLRSRAQGIVALDFFPVETAWLRTLDVLFAIEAGSRRLSILGVTTNPDWVWTTQQARNLAGGDRLASIGFVIRHRDAEFCGPFDQVFGTKGARILRTPI